MDQQPEDCLLRTTILGVLPYANAEIICTSCGQRPLVAYMGYSYAKYIISVDRGGFCETCDTIILSGDFLSE